MFRLCLFLLFFLTITVKSIFAQSSCSDFAPRPENPALMELITNVQSCGGAAKLVPASVLRSIYLIESGPVYLNPGNYTCKKYSDTGMGLFQAIDAAYKLVVPPDQRLNNEEGVCESTANKLSRCNPADAVEIAARILLSRVGFWDSVNFKPLGTISTKNGVYNASCNYYGGGGISGPFEANSLTSKLSVYLSAKPPDGQTSYCEFVCGYSGFCPSTASFPWPRGLQPYPPPPLNPPDFNLSFECLNRFSPTGTNNSPSTENSSLSLPDYLESVFPKLAPQNIQDRYKNAMILRAGSNPDQRKDEIINLYGFAPATIQIHDYKVGSLKLSQLELKPLDNPQALKNWEQSTTAKVWKDIPMFTREDTKGFIEAPPGTSPAFTEVIHPDLPRLYEVSSALGLLTPYQKEVKPIAKSSSQSVSKFLTGTGELAKDSRFITTINQTVNNPYYDPNAATMVTDNCGTHSACEKCDPKKPDGIDDSGCYTTAAGDTIPSVTFKTYTPFLNEIRHNLIGQSTGAFNIFNLGQPFAQNIPALRQDADTKPNQAKFYYPLLGSLHCAQQKVLSFLQPFTGQNIAIDPACINNNDNNHNADGLAGTCPDGGEEISSQLASVIQNGQVQLLPNSVTARSPETRLCITPTMIVIHWAGGWDNDQSNEGVYNTLISRNRACQLATDTNDTILMQPFYETQVELPWCANAWNIFSINNELAGGYLPDPKSPDYGKIDIRFTDRNGNPPRIGDPSRPGLRVFPEKSVVDHAINATCAIMKQYNIPWTQVFGHYDVPRAGKEDPGKEFLENYFIPRLKNECQ